MASDTNILTQAEKRFGTNSNPKYVYYSVAAQNLGSTILKGTDNNPQGAAVSLTAPGIDCSALVTQSLLAAGYNVGPNDLTVSGGNFVPGLKFSSVTDFSQVGPGTIVTFNGHVGIVVTFNNKVDDPQYGTGTFYGAQTSTGPVIASFSIDPNASDYWGGSNQLFTVKKASLSSRERALPDF